MLLITLAIFLPLVLLTAWQARRRAEADAHDAPRPAVARPARAASSRAAGASSAARSIAIFVFLLMCAAFVACRSTW